MGSNHILRGCVTQGLQIHLNPDEHLGGVLRPIDDILDIFSLAENTLVDVDSPQQELPPRVDGHFRYVWSIVAIIGAVSLFGLFLFRSKWLQRTSMLMLAVLLTNSNFLVGQVYHLESLTRYEFGLSVNAEGELTKSPSVLSGGAWLNDAELLKQDEHLKDTLEFSQDQRQRFNQFYQKYRSRLAREFPGAVYDESLVENCKRVITDFQVELDAILTDSQQQQLRQARHRLQSQLFGLTRILRQSKSWSDLTAEQRSKIRRCIQTRRQFLLERRDEFQNSHVKELKLLLDAQQSRDFQDLFEEVVNSYKVPVELLAFQLSLTGSEDFITHSKKNSLNALHLPTGYALLASGRLHVRWAEEVSAANLPIAKLTLLRNPQLAARLDLSEAQVRSLNEIADRYKREYSEINARAPLPKSTDHSEDPEVYIERREQSRQNMERFKKEVVAPFHRSIEKAIDDVLIPHQQRTLVDAILQIEIQRMGLSTSLAHGGVGKRLKITERQRERLLEWRKDQLEKLLDLMREMEEELLTELDEILGANHELSLKTLIGEIDEKIWPAPGLLLTDPIIDF